MKSISMFALLLLAPSPSSAATLEFGTTANLRQLAGEIKEATGLRLLRECPEPSCTVNGHIIVGPGFLRIEVYEKPVQGAPWIVPVAFDAKMKEALHKISVAHRPRSSEASGARSLERIRALAKKWEAGAIEALEKDELLKLLVMREAGLD